MTTKISLLTILLALCISTGFSQSSELSANRCTSDYLALISKSALAHSGVVLPGSLPALSSYADFIPTEKYANVNQFIYSNLVFPEEARITGRSGIVQVQFDIYPDGKIGNIEFIESPDKSFNKEIMRIFDQMPIWKPAYSASGAVTSRYQLNINFSLR